MRTLVRHCAQLPLHSKRNEHLDEEHSHREEGHRDDAILFLPKGGRHREEDRLPRRIQQGPRE